MLVEHVSLVSVGSANILMHILLHARLDILALCISRALKKLYLEEIFVQGVIIVKLFLILVIKLCRCLVLLGNMELWKEVRIFLL